MLALIVAILLVVALASELALRIVWHRLPEPNRYCQAMYAPKIKRMQALASQAPIDVVIIGHSVNAIGIDPEIVLEHLPEGATCFNAAVGLSNIHTQERFVPEYVLPLLRPRLVLLGTRSGALNASGVTQWHKNYDKAWMTSKTIYGKMRRLITSRSKLLDAIENCLRDSDYRKALWRMVQRKNGQSATQRVDNHISDLGHRRPLAPTSDYEALMEVGIDPDQVIVYEPGPYMVDSWLRMRDLFDALPDSRFGSFLMPSSPRRTARRQNGLDDQRLGAAEWSKFCDEQRIFRVTIDDGTYTDDEFGDADHPLWPAVRRQSNALGAALAERWDELMGHSTLAIPEPPG